jgi:hypothetical protein
VTPFLIIKTIKVSDLNFISGSLNIFTADSAASLDLEISAYLIEPILRLAITQPFLLCTTLLISRALFASAELALLGIRTNLV